MERPSPARQKRKQAEGTEASSSGGVKAGRLTWARVNRARTGYDANNHMMADPIWRSTKSKEMHKADCQWCKFKWIDAGKPRPPDSKAKNYEGPQNKEVLFCTLCRVHLCSAQCWNEFHGLCAVCTD
jgi:hypothetical protein